MFTKNQAFGLLAAVIAIAPSAAMAQEAPNPEPQQNQVTQTQVRQTPNNGSNLLPGVAGAVLNGVTGNKNNIIPGVAGAVLDAVTRKKNPANIVPGVNEAVNAVTNQQQQDNTSVENAPPVQQSANNSLPKTHLCNARGGVEASVQNLNPLNITSGIVGGVREILGQQTDSPNKLRANGDLGCLPLPR